MKINFGCGNDIKKGFLNVDKIRLKGVDKVMDLDRFPYDLPDSSVDEILCKHLLLHVKDVNKVIKEFHRILKPKGKLNIIVPHFTYAGSFTDPTGLRTFAYNYFDYFVKGYHYNYYYDFGFSRIIGKKIIFGKRYAIWNYFIEPLANQFPMVYENTIMRIFPAEELSLTMIK